MGFITYTPAGRIGNAMFQAATCFGYSKRYDVDFTMPFITGSEKWAQIPMKWLQDKRFDPYTSFVEIVEIQHNYQYLPFKEEWRSKNIRLTGYWQTSKYFSECREEMLKTFNIPWNLINDTCSIHARYGDYLTIPGKHIVINEKYLTQAMRLITEKTGITKFKVFSDDIELFKQRHGNLYNFEYSTNSDEWSDLVDISCCHSHINSSSTFSFWGAYLNRNENKIVITPKDWFQPGYGNLNTADIIEPDWIKI